MKNEDQPAFPTTDTVNDNGRFEPLNCGLTKREYFAAMAMQGLCADTNMSQSNIPILAIKIADETLKILDVKD